MRTAVASLALMAAAAVGLAGCGPGVAGPGVTSTGAGSSTDGGSASSPAAAPTATSTAPAATTPAAGAGERVVRMKWCADVCNPLEATVVMRDGRVVWNEPNLGMRQGRLSPAGVAWVEEQLDATGLLDQAASYDPEIRPGAQPEGGGVSLFEFTTDSPSGPVDVRASMPAGVDDATWIVPPEAKTLADLAGAMIVADDWIPAELWLEPSEPFAPGEYLLLVTLNPNRTGDAIDPRAAVDVDRVLWPLPGAIDTAVPLAPSMGDPRARCAVLDARLATLIDDAQRAQGLPGEPRDPFAERVYLWQRGGGFLTVAFQSLLPDEHDCANAGFALD